MATASPTPTARDVLTPDAFAMLQAIERHGSFAAAARQLGKVPSALTYQVRRLEEALDVLLFDRRSRQAVLTSAGRELLVEGGRLLDQVDAVANRVRRVATGWESALTIAVDAVLCPATVLDLCDAFYALEAAAPPTGAAGTSAGRRPVVTRLSLRTDVLVGTWEALQSGRADLAVGIVAQPGRTAPPGIVLRTMGETTMVFVVAPRHPLATATAPIADGELVGHRAVAVADTAHSHVPLTVNLLPGQDVLTVSSLEAKVAALVRGLGCGWLPAPLARQQAAAGQLIVKDTDRRQVPTPLAYAWRTAGTGPADTGLALAWWLQQLASPRTRHALVERCPPG